nr:hypothetical protein [Tanacetum cinerariifolium]
MVTFTKGIMRSNTLHLLRTISKVPNTKDTIRFKLDTQEITYTLDMFHDTLHLPVKTPNNPFVAAVTIEIIESFMQRVGYQGVVYKDYHSIKNDIPLVSVYTMANVIVRRMLISDAFLTEEIRAIDNYKEYKTVFEEKKDDVMGSLEYRNEKMQTPIPATPRSPRINLSSNKNIAQELIDTVSLSTATTSKDPHKKKCISSKYNHLPGALRRMCRRQGYMIRDMERMCLTTDDF